MSNIKIDKQKAVKKWTPVLENMGVEGQRVDWMSEYAEYHSINENAYANAANVSGMGQVKAAQPSSLPGATIGNNFSGNNGTEGNGDVGQNLLPVAMKIAAQTIGLDLVAVKPSPGPKIDLLFVDFRYDDAPLGEEDEKPQVFKADFKGDAKKDVKTAIKGVLNTLGVKETQGGLTKTVYLRTDGLTQRTDETGAGVGPTFDTSGETLEDVGGSNNKTSVVEFLGFSRIDGLPMFRAFRQFNTASSGGFRFDPKKNTFGAGQAMTEQLKEIATVDLTATIDETEIELVSTLEDHIPGFSANWNTGQNFSGDYPMDREQDDKRYAGIIGPKISSKTVAVGTIEVTSALRRTEIEDIKANTGMDIVQKMESILVNELSQTISKQIVSKLFEMGELNRESAPSYNGTGSLFDNSMVDDPTIFDLDTAYAGTGNVGGETTHAVQRKLITKIAHASNFLATEGRVGPAQYLVTNGGLAAALSDISGYTINPSKSNLNGAGQLYPVGSIGDISIYVDPYMKYDDNRILIGRKNNPDQPGVIFVPYLMAQSISVISEATFAPRMLLRSRYAVTEVGFFPQKQFMTLHVVDNNGLLN